jgi:hypothetical protein
MGLHSRCGDCELILLNLAAQNLIGKGTWIGIQTDEQKLLRRVVIDSITTQGEIIATDIHNNQKIKFAHNCVVEIEGMLLSRFLQQADLDHNGIKIINLVRRGRKPKIRT